MRTFLLFALVLLCLCAWTPAADAHHFTLHNGRVVFVRDVAPFGAGCGDLQSGPNYGGNLNLQSSFGGLGLGLGFVEAALLRGRFHGGFHGGQGAHGHHR